MRETKSNGKTYIPVPTGPRNALENLRRLGEREQASEKTLSAIRWERAMIVAALCGPIVRGRPVKTGATVFTTGDLEKERIPGLLDSDTINACRKAWFDVAEMPAVMIGDLGKPVELPSIEYPMWREGTHDAEPAPAEFEEDDETDDDDLDEWVEELDDESEEEEQGSEPEDDRPEDKRKMPIRKRANEKAEPDSGSIHALIKQMDIAIRRVEEHPDLISTEDLIILTHIIQVAQKLRKAAPKPNRRLRAVREEA